MKRTASRSQMIALAIFTFLIVRASFLQAAAPVPVEGGSAEEKSSGQTWNFTPDPNLPNVLIIGDSISIGYTLFVRAELQKEANIFRPMDRDGKKPFNCGDSARGIDLVGGWLGTNRWRVIHFNFGLHDLKYLDEKKQYVTPDKGKQVATPDVYEKNLRDFVALLKKTGAVLVWGSTTPVPDGSPGRVKGDELVYNKTAKRVMEECGVLTDDLYAALGDRVSELQKPNNVHFTDEGSKILAASVVASIREAFKKPASSPEPVASPYATEFRLSSPVVEKVSSESLYIMATITLPKGIQFKPGLAIEASAEIDAAADPVSFNAQILSADGKMSSFPFRGAEKSKRASAKLEIPDAPSLHASSKSKEPWKEGDVIKQIRIYFTLPAKAAATIKVTSLAIGAK